MAATCQFAIYIDEIVYFLLKLLRADLGCDASFSLFEFLAFIYIYILFMNLIVLLIVLFN